jgi:hypothetical protein
MPALITHHLFGEEASKRLPSGILSTQEELLAFLLGNQGPDPFFSCFSALPRTASNCHRLAFAMHGHHVVENFWAMRAAVSHLPECDEHIGLAFVLGFVGHYSLDSSAHPLIYAEQHELTSAGTGLSDAADEVHAVIESDIDVWMLAQLRGLSVADVPTASFLARTARIDRVAGALLSQAALQVFSLPIGVREYAGCTADYERAYRLVDPAENPKMRIAAQLESLVRPHSHLRAMAHHVSCAADCPSANLANHAWKDPADGHRRNESFPELYHQALDLWQRLAKALTTDDRQTFIALSGHLNYNGIPEG